MTASASSFIGFRFCSFFSFAFTLLSFSSSFFSLRFWAGRKETVVPSTPSSSCSVGTTRRGALAGTQPTVTAAPCGSATPDRGAGRVPRGGAVARCSSPGPLSTVTPQARRAVHCDEGPSPAPWSSSRVGAILGAADPCDGGNSCRRARRVQPSLATRRCATSSGKWHWWWWWCRRLSRPAVSIQERTVNAANFGGHVPVDVAPRPFTSVQVPRYLIDVGAMSRRASLREALYVQDVEGMRQACSGAHADAGTLSPAINTSIATARASGRCATQERSTRNPPKVSTNRDPSAHCKECADSQVQWVQNPPAS